MADPTQVWDPNWRALVDARIRALGFTDITALLTDMPARAYRDVADRLGNTAPIQIIALQFQEARDSNQVREAAKDSLARNIVEKLPNGWGIGKNAEFQTASALGNWSSEIETTGDCRNAVPKLQLISRALFREEPPPMGWIPNGPNDPIIERVFDRHWS